MEKMPRPKIEETSTEDMSVGQVSRRNFLKGFGATILSTSVAQMAEANVESSPRPYTRTNQEIKAGEDIKNTEAIKQKVYDTYEPLDDKVLHLAPALLTDIELVAERISSLVIDDEKYASTLHLIHEELVMKGIPEPIYSEIKDMMLYVPYVESRFSNEAVSSVKAFGIMQLMPSVWDELAGEGEEKENILDQVKVAGRLLEQTYQYISKKHSDTIRLITELLFDGDKERCGKEFVCPLIINAYFSGMGTIDEVLSGFCEDYVNKREKTRMQTQGILEDELGVYGIFSTAAKLHQYSEYYGAESGKYVPKIIASKYAMRVGLPASYLAELMPEYTKKGGSEV